MNQIKLLLFPLDMDECDAVIRVASAMGIEVIGASSAMDGPGKKNVDHFLKLPYVTEDGFDPAFEGALEEYGITTVFAPHQGVWRHLNTLTHNNSRKITFRLCHPPPFTATWKIFEEHEHWAESAALSPIASWIDDRPLRPPLSRSCHAALHRQFLNTPGQCDEAKLSALCDVFRLLTDGDVLEVGCLYGRSALALGYLAQRHKIGNLICVDPWNVAVMTDQGAQAAVLNKDLDWINFEQIFRIFLSTAATLDNVGYIRHTSEAAHPIYEAARANGHLDSPELGRIFLAGHLSLVHIDGNHRYDHVKKDVETWSPYLVPGGWLLLDDYVWAFGDGPKRIGDELLDSQLYDTAFVSSDTLFLRRNSVAPTHAD
ncbi:MAG: class I SAM-dependent methyltransferase [Burkholderiaceae bacterium]|nr:MAG: class I SAM-dependent methyltransferase [Burkholderiaceae bacterium]